MLFMAALLAVAAAIAAVSCDSGGSQGPTVTLSLGVATVVATGSSDAMVARASKITGLDVVIPKPLPPGAYLKQIVVPTADSAIPGVTPRPRGATVIIAAPPGQYFIDELARGSQVGVTEADGEVKSFESPGRAVYWNATGFGYTIIGKERSYYLESGDPASNKTAKADLAKMIPSLPVE